MILLQSPMLRVASAFLAVLVLASCETSTKIKGLPEKLPVINLEGSSATPAHSMSHSDYPFEPDGDYNTAWASEGGQGAGMDYSSWRSSHGSSRSSSSSKKSSSKSSRSSGRTHSIKSGDTLGAIARKYGTSVSKLKAANGLKSDLIRAGKTLKIP
ncbi:MAG: LysM peptidoglycan-binding domain-containing protein [Prosthecobacter sp.]